MEKTQSSQINNNKNEKDLDIRDIELLWVQTYNKGYDVRKNKKNGLDEWQPLKNKYALYNFATYKNGIPLKKSFRILCEKIKYSHNENDIDHNYVTVNINDIILDNIDRNHFFVQHFRIPIMGKFILPVVKILQIAYNAGQFKSDVENKQHDQTVVNFYNKYELGNINTYIEF